MFCLKLAILRLICFTAYEAKQEVLMSVEYIVVLPIDSLEIGNYLENTGLHCTLMHWFALSPSIKEIDVMGAIAQLKPSDGSKGIDLYAEKSGLFGPNSDVSVSILAENAVLHTMHNEFRRFLGGHQCKLARNDWIGANYRPHVTTILGKEFAAGAFHRATQLALIRRNIGKKYKEVIHLRRF
jgi:hypothetical protein